ncbi:MAG TPA: hypothetical protein VNP73_00520 [Actinomycetota bacterium]|nr:hypothetical protein [Actinomycetota bacterium]
MSATTVATQAVQSGAGAKLKLLRFVLLSIAIGHLVVGFMFWFRPDLAVEEILAWGPASGWTTILGSYDLSVAFALFLAYRNPLDNLGIVKFVGVLLVLHGLTHLYYTVIGDSPARFYFVVSYLIAGGIALLWLGSNEGLKRDPVATPSLGP